jgi:hypothetical protein
MNLLLPLQKTQPSLTAKEGSYPFVESAILADDMKYKGWGW